MAQDVELYYTAPSDEIFNDLKAAVIKLRIELSPDFHHEKTKKLQEIENIRDNFMFIYATLDIYNQIEVLYRISKKTEREIFDRLPEDYFGEAIRIAALLGL